MLKYAERPLFPDMHFGSLHKCLTEEQLCKSKNIVRVSIEINALKRAYGKVRTDTPGR